MPLVTETKPVFIPAQNTPLRSALGAQVTGDLTEDDVVDAVIAFANGTISPSLAAYTVSDDSSGDRRFYSIRSPKMEVVSEEAARAEAGQFIERWRTFARTALSAAAKGSTFLDTWIEGESATRRVLEVSLRPVLRRATGEQRKGLSWEMTGPHIAPDWIVFAALVASATAKDGRTVVGQCRLHECGSFFRVETKKRGKPARDYCPGTDHGMRARPPSTERVKAWRERQREAKAKQARKRK